MSYYITNKEIFENFNDYYYYARDLTQSQKALILESLDKNLKNKILSAFNQEGWIDLISMESINKLIDFVEKEYKFNLFDIRYKVLKHKSVYIPKSLWEYITYELDGFKKEHKEMIIGGVYTHQCKTNKNVLFLSHKQTEEVC
jgi:hypothetical protein